jgi:hypothetical protein
MKQPTAKDLFGFITDRVQDVAHREGTKPYRAFPRWFAEMYYQHPEKSFSADGTGDGKVDFFFHTVTGNSVTQHVVNSKYTDTYGQIAPVTFYDEVLAFYQLFNEPSGRKKFVQSKVKEELRPFYKTLFDAFDAGKAKLLFLTNCRKNLGQLARVEQLQVETFHLEDLIQYVLDDLDGAMPRTPNLILQQIATTLSPPTDETGGVATTLVFGRLVDFIEYMDNDPYGLLFARNVRVSLGNTPVNRQIGGTFIDHPEQFAYSNNGLTILCERATHDPASQELLLVNPRVVNGAQTLYSVHAASGTDLKHLSVAIKGARVMLRIIITPAAKGMDGAKQASETKEILNRISIRSNQQNPIRSWNLRANDEFQMEVMRRFRYEDLFYERRDKEWRLRSRQLKNVGITRGPSIKQLVARAACYHWKNPKLGPALAKGNLGELFQGDGYDAVAEGTPPELAYQLYLISENIDESLRSLGQRKYKNARRHIDLAVFTVACRALTAAGMGWKKPQLTERLTFQRRAWINWRKPWQYLARSAADVVLNRYVHMAAQSNRHEEELTLKNYVRRREEMNLLMKASLPRHVVKAAKIIVSSQ